MEGDGLGLDLALLHIDLVTAQDDGDVLANTDEVTWIIISCEQWMGTRGYSRCQLGTFL